MKIDNWYIEHVAELLRDLRREDHYSEDDCNKIESYLYDISADLEQFLCDIDNPKELDKPAEIYQRYVLITGSGYYALGDTFSECIATYEKLEKIKDTYDVGGRLYHFESKLPLIPIGDKRKHEDLDGKYGDVYCTDHGGVCWWPVDDRMKLSEIDIKRLPTD